MYIFFSTFKNQATPFHYAASLPDSGANRSLWHPRALKNKGITVHELVNEVVTVADAGIMRCTGYILLRVRHGDDPEGHNEIIVNALVSPSLKQDVIVCFNDLKRLGVIGENFPGILSCRNSSATCTAANAEDNMGEDSIERIVAEYADVFDAVKLTPLRGEKMKIHIDRDAPGYRPIQVLTARKTALHFTDPADAALKWFLDSDVIEPVGIRERTEWCSPGFFVPKPASANVRLVVDFSLINRYIQRSPHPFMSARDVLKQIRPDSRWFGCFDVVQGYHQVLIDEESRHLTTFLLPQGRYRFKRAPMGMICSGDYFNFLSDAILAPVPDKVKLVDDGLVQHVTKQGTFERIREVCEASREGNLTLSVEKLKVAEQVEFAGFIISAEGIKAEPYKLATLHGFPSPKNLQQLRSFLGAAQQLAFYVPDLAHVSAPLRPLLKKHNAFLWLEEHEAAFLKVKDILTSDMVIRPFDPKLPTRLLCDASRLCGLGYALCNVATVEGIERLQLVQCNSRSLSAAEQRYAVNELEATALMWAILDAKYFLLGMPSFQVYTDHRTLKSVFEQPLAEVVNSRIMRIREKLFDYVFTVEWIPGNRHALADALSRLPVSQPDEAEREYDGTAVCHSITVYEVTATEEGSDPCLSSLFAAARDDDDYRHLHAALRQGRDVNKLPHNHYARKFRDAWNELSTHGDLVVFQGKRIVVPNAERKQILEKLHRGHPGIVRSIQLARRTYYWPGFSKDVRGEVENCSRCQEVRPSQNEEDPIHIPEPTAPMQSCGTDLAKHRGIQHIILVDRYSGMIWCKQLKRETSEAIIRVLHQIFARNGYPQWLHLDGGPCYDSFEFETYCEAHHIRLARSSPGFPRSNGLSEAAVKSAKAILEKTDNFEQFEDHLLSWMNVPSQNSTSTPAERFFGRRLRDGLPTLDDVYVPYEECDDAAPRFKAGDRVFMQGIKSGRWDETGTILHPSATKKSFLVARDKGGQWVRNQHFLRLMPPATPADRPPTRDAPAENRGIIEDRRGEGKQSNTEHHSPRRSKRIANKHVRSPTSPPEAGASPPRPR